MGQSEFERIFLDAASLNNMTYVDFHSRLTMLAVSMFEWNGLPDTVDARFLEKTLYMYGKALFIYDDTLGYLVTKCVPSGQLNHYELPVSYTAFSLGYNKAFPADKCVLVMNNLEMRPTEWTIRLYAGRLYEVERTLDTNIKAQKTPVLVKCAENQRQTLKNLYAQYDGNMPFIFGEKALDTSTFTVLKTDAPFVSDKLMLYKHDIWNECMSFLGVKNANTDKKERLIVSEVESNDDMISLAAQTMLLSRQQAAAQINKMYGLNVSVRLRDISTKYYEDQEDQEDQEEELKGGEE
jgi:hypothetical protein